MSLGSSADELFTAPLTRKLVGKKKKRNRLHQLSLTRGATLHRSPPLDRSVNIKDIDSQTYHVLIC